MTPETFVTPSRAPRNRRWLVVALVLLVVVAGGVAAYFALVRDRDPQQGPGAVVVFHIAPQPPHLMPGPPEPPGAFEAYRQSQVGLVKMRRTLNAALKDPRVRDLRLIRESEPDPLTWLEERLHVTSEPSSDYLRIVLKGEPLKETLVLLGAVADAYLDASRERDSGAKTARLGELQKAHAEMRAEMRQFHVKLTEYARVLGAGDLQTLAILNEMRLANLKSCYVTLDRTQDELALLLATHPGKPDPAHRQAFTALGGGPVATTAPVRLIPLKAEDTPEGRRLRAEEQVTLARLEAVSRSLYEHNNLTRELEEIKKDLRRKEELADRMANEIERLRLEAKAPPRVTLVDEPAALGPR